MQTAAIVANLASQIVRAKHFLSLDTWQRVCVEFVQWIEPETFFSVCTKEQVDATKPETAEMADARAAKPKANAKVYRNLKKEDIPDWVHQRVATEFRPLLMKGLAVKQAALAKARKNEARKDIHMLEAEVAKYVETLRVLFDHSPVSVDPDPSPEPSTTNGSAKSEPRSTVQASAPVVAKPAPEVRPVPEAKPTKKRGKRNLKEDIMAVMGDHTMNAKQVYEALSDQDWLPMSNEPRGYVAYTLSAFPEKFARVSRGQYRVATATPAPKSESSPTSLPMSAMPDSTEAVLREAGILPLSMSDSDSEAADTILRDAGIFPREQTVQPHPVSRPPESRRARRRRDVTLRDAILRVVCSSLRPLSADAVLAGVRQTQPDADRALVGPLLLELCKSGALVKAGRDHKSRFSAPVRLSGGSLHGKGSRL